MDSMLSPASSGPRRRGDADGGSGGGMPESIGSRSTDGARMLVGGSAGAASSGSAREAHFAQGVEDTTGDGHGHASGAGMERRRQSLHVPHPQVSLLSGEVGVFDCSSMSNTEAARSAQQDPSRGFEPCAEGRQSAQPSISRAATTGGMGPPDTHALTFGSLRGTRVAPSRRAGFP